MVNSLDKILITDIPVYNIKLNQLFDFIDKSIEKKEKNLILTLSTEIFMYAKKNKEFKDILYNSLVIPDSAGIMLASRILNKPLKEKLSGIDIFIEIVKKNKWKIFLLGAKPNIANLAKQNLENKYKINCIVGTHHGYFKDNQVNDIINKINKSKAEILAIALGSPKQEQFFVENKDNLNVNIAIGLGGSFDVLSGKVKRAPKFMQNFGLEWLWRVFLQPSRIKRITILPIFLINIFLYKLKKEEKNAR